MTEKDKLTPRISTAPVPHTPFRCEIDGGKGGMSVLFYGINSIKDFSGEEVLMRSAGFFVRLSGLGLTLSVYENKSVEIFGRVLNVELIYDKN